MLIFLLHFYKDQLELKTGKGWHWFEEGILRAEQKLGTF